MVFKGYVMKRAFLILLAVIVMQGCTKEVDKGLKSPCVSNDYYATYSDNTGPVSRPCGIRRPVNSTVRTSV